MPNFVHGPKDSHAKFRERFRWLVRQGLAESVKAQAMPITLAKG